MLVGGDKKISKPEKTKFRKNQENDWNNTKKEKPKHHDKSYYRLVKQEEREVDDEL
jgi:hypothetical protein